VSVTASESALVVLAPEAEPIVKAYRDEHDPSAALGVPAHLTVLYPFHPGSLSPAARGQLASLFADCAPFDYQLTELRRFPGTLYLAPEPAEPFRLLTRRVTQVFPNYPPYRGRYSDIIPHLTVAQLEDEARLETVAAHFQVACAARLPLRLRATAVTLLEYNLGAWQVVAAFALAVGE
jgi:2'-5' RNA ligase superfamily protein